jgi:hypothetical protein
LLAEQQTENDTSKHELAENITQVWQRMQVLKHDPEIQAILRDKEVIKLVENKNPLALLANEKIQIIVDRVMELDTKDFDFSAFEIQESKTQEPDTQEPEAQEAEVENRSLPLSSTPIYTWRDDQGKIQFSDYQSIPPNKRDQAVQTGGSMNE